MTVWKYLVLGAVMACAFQARAQQTPPTPRRAACPQGTSYASIRHNVIKPGKWSEFQQAVAQHTAWYAAKGNPTQIKIVRMPARPGGEASLSITDAVTITRYAGQQPERDGGYAAFAAKYKDSATVRDDMRVCLPN